MKLAALFFALAIVPLSPEQEPTEPGDAALLARLVSVRASARIARDLLPAVRPGGSLASDGAAVAAVARAAIETGALESAEHLLREARPAKAPARIEIERARLAFARDELERASSQLTVTDDRGTRLRHPDEPEAWILFARTHARLLDYETADRAARRYLAVAPRGIDSAVAWQIRTDAALRRNDAEAAHALLQKAKEHRAWHELLVARRLQCLRSPDAELPRLGLALVWMEAEDFERARAVLRELVERSPGFARGWFHLGEAERGLGRAKEAEAAYDEALRLEPSHAPSLANRAAMRSARGAWEEARRDYEVLLGGDAGEDSRFLEAHLGLVRVLRALGEEEAAEERLARYRGLGGKGEE